MNTGVSAGVWGFVCGPGAPAGWAAFLPLLAPITLLALYLAAVARGAAWADIRTASFALGCLLIALVLTPAALDWAALDARGHMAQHLVLGMFAPLALVMGRPGTLFLRAVPVGFARSTARLLGTMPVRVLTHPLTAALLSTGSLYVLYLTSFGQAVAADPWGHSWLLLHFVVAGSLFAWAVAGPDPAPHRPDHGMRLLALFLSGAAHMALAARLGAFPPGLGPNEVEAATWMLYGGDVGEALLALAFFHSWHTSRQRRREVREAPTRRVPSSA